MTDVSAVAAGLPRTVQVYWNDSYRTELVSNITRAVQDEKRYWYIVLDETIFHPKGGGQPSDRGMLRGAGFKFEVRKAMLAANGVIVHWGKTLEGAPKESPADSKLDWDWRFLMMRRHSAAHLLDHCLAQVAGSNVETLDSWLGDQCYVAYKGQPPSAKQLAEVETLENQVIKRGASVTSEEVSTEQLKREYADSPNLQRLPSTERLRLVTIEGCRPIACGGTHPRNVSEARSIRIGKLEMVDKGFRIHYDVA